MDENVNQVQEFPEDDWGDIDLSDVLDAENTPPAEAPEATDQTPPAAEETPSQPPAQPQAQQEADQSFQLKHLDEVRTVNRDEVIALAQKGMDYDRIRAKLDEKTAADASAAEALAFLEEMARGSNMSVQDFMDSAIAVRRSKPDKSDYDAVLAQVKLERREKALDAREAQLRTTREQEDKRSQAEQRKQADIQRFVARFPNVQATAIPKEVWAEVAKGASLTEAYAMHENARLQAELEAERQNAKNAARSTGSRATAGKQERDAFDALWYDDD
mgnify:CR=1 FL=1